MRGTTGPRSLPGIDKASPRTAVIGVFAAGDPRIDEDSRARCRNIIRRAAGTISGAVVTPEGTPVPVVYSDILVDNEFHADLVAEQFRKAGVNILVGVPDTWAFPQLTTISLLQQFPAETPINITCGNSAPRPGLVYAHATAGAISQYGRLVSLNVGNWPDTGADPAMTRKTASDLIDWCYAAVAATSLRGRRVLVFGHDSMGMETALAHVLATRNVFGLEVTRLDMKLLADLLARRVYDGRELKALRSWIDRHIGARLELRDASDGARFDMSLAMYLIVRDLMAELNAVGGGFMSQLEWGSDARGLPLPVADVMESLFNSTFDHNGPKAPIPYATESDVQALLTMLAMTWLSGGSPPLFMDFRKVWEGWEVGRLAKGMNLGAASRRSAWYRKGFVDGNNSGSAAFDWAALPGSSVERIMRRIRMPLASPEYFPGGGNSIAFRSPGGIEGIAGRMAYSHLTSKFSLVWDQVRTAELPDKLADKICRLSDPSWPHTFVVPEYASMTEYKQYAPANHLHMVWGLPVARLQHWMDLTGVLSVTPWAARPRYIEGIDRPQPLVHLINGGEDAFKLMRT